MKIPFSLIGALSFLIVGCGKEQKPTALEGQPASGDVQQADTALKSKQYDQVATALINLEKSVNSGTLPPSQAGQAAFQLRQLQLQLQSAAASGDPAAVAAMSRVNAARHR